MTVRALVWLPEVIVRWVRSLHMIPSVEADHVTVNTTAFSSEPRHEKDISGRTVPIRIINPDKKSEYKTYTLRNLSSYSFTDLSHLKKEIASQLGDKVSSDPCSSVG